MIRSLLFLTVILLLFGCDSARQNERISLNAGWKFRAPDSTWRTAMVPGVIHTDLLAHDLIPHPWVGTNEDSVQWVESQVWEYRTRFELAADQLSSKGLDLIFEGLDTYAEVTLNGRPLLFANNMFRSWRVPVVKSARLGANTLLVRFFPPTEINKEKLNQLGYELPAGSEQVDLKVSPLTRKAAYHFGWDWGPRLVTAGIWRPVHLETYDLARIEDVQILQKSLSDSIAMMEAAVEVVAIAEAELRLRVMNQDLVISLKKGLNRFRIPFQILKPKRWWPNGWGEPHLYQIPVSLIKGNDLLDQDTVQFGLRTVELIQEPDSIGESFFFKVNGEKLFARGANYIPQSHFLPEVTDEDYRGLLGKVQQSGMNMLRVWGGGIYEDDRFYDLCDELGILVWQDFMFANSMYPGDVAFIENVKVEVTENVKRLRNHPSIIHWNGNNEIQVAWENWGWQDAFGYSEQDSAKIWQDYLFLFHDLIPSLVDSLDYRSYTTTSPLSNWGTPENFNYGSMHYWGVWHGGDDFADYRNNVGRFMSEYGFQSFPVLETVTFFADTAQWDLDSPAMKHHQKSYVGNGLMLSEIEKYYDTPKDFHDFIEKSQLTQALAMQQAIDAHRLAKGHCWGSLFWQLNDCWPGPSWSAIDVFGREKVLYSKLSKLLSAQAVIPNRRGDYLDLWIVNDALADLTGDLELLIYDQADEFVIEMKLPVTCKANGKKRIRTLQLKPNWHSVEVKLIKADTLAFARKDDLEFL